MEDIGELLQVYLNNNKMYHFDNDTGVRRMERVMNEVCGYTPSWGGTMHNFFGDNPGAIQAVIEWIGNQRNADWKENLEAMVGPSEEGEVGDLMPPEEVALEPNYDPRDYVVRGYK